MFVEVPKIHTNCLSVCVHLWFTKAPRIARGIVNFAEAILGQAVCELLSLFC